MQSRFPAAADLLPAAPPPCQAVAVFRPHDLLWTQDWHGLVFADPVPPWAVQARNAGQPAVVVVRRDRTGDPALLPVGLRGVDRSQRLGALLQRAAVAHWVSPEKLARAPAPGWPPDPGAAKVFATLERISPLLDASGLVWGPTGSLGYTLATGLPALHCGSDIDLLVRAPSPLSAPQARLLHAAAASDGCRVDLQVDTGRGGFSFTEWSRGGAVLLKTDVGPFLTADPWGRDGWLDRLYAEAT